MRHTTQLPGRIYWSATGATSGRMDDTLITNIDPLDGDISIHILGGLYLSMPPQVWDHLVQAVSEIRPGVPA